jgi:hypothetical protein
MMEGIDEKQCSSSTTGYIIDSFTCTRSSTRLAKNYVRLNSRAFLLFSGHAPIQPGPQSAAQVEMSRLIGPAGCHNELTGPTPVHTEMHPEEGTESPRQIVVVLLIWSGDDRVEVGIAPEF